MARKFRSIAEEATLWLARRDRGLTAAEQDQFLEWLRRDPRHAEEIARFEQSWSRLDILAQHPPDFETVMDRDPRIERGAFRSWKMVCLLVSCAAAVCVGLWVSARSGTAANMARVESQINRSMATGNSEIIRREPEQRVLPDGSVVELKAGAELEVVFEPSLRRVRLISGEAHFKVAKNPARPFVVETRGVAVRAVGTAFLVDTHSPVVAVLVTEGKVQVSQPVGSQSHPGEPPPLAPTLLVAGQRATIDSSAPASPQVSAVDPDEMEQSLEWRGLHLKFREIPLSKAVKEFNRYNPSRLIIGDDQAGALRVDGSFRADNVDAFVRLAEKSWGIVATKREDGATVLSTK